MKKGQLSFDLILAILLALLLVHAIQIVTNNTNLTQQKISIKTQERFIAITLAQLIESQKTLQTPNSTISYAVPLLKTIENETITCTITQINTTLTISAIDPKSNETITTTTQLSSAANRSWNCGETITLSGS